MSCVLRSYDMLITTQLLLLIFMCGNNNVTEKKKSDKRPSPLTIKLARGVNRREPTSGQAEHERVEGGVLCNTHNSDADLQISISFNKSKMIWFDIAWPQWVERNRVDKGHGSNANADQLESELLTREHASSRATIPIHQQQQPLAELQLHEILRMRPATRRSWLHHIEAAVTAW